MLLSKVPRTTDANITARDKLTEAEPNNNKKPTKTDAKEIKTPSRKTKYYDFVDD